MKNELTVKKGELVTVIDDLGIGEILKPLVSEIHLFDTNVAGTAYLQDVTPLYAVKAGDRLTLKRENNRYDEKAILVLDSQGRKLGYVPEKDNIVFSRLMDAGKLLIARVSSVKDMEYFFRIAISIYLVDY